MLRIALVTFIGGGILGSATSALSYALLAPSPRRVLWAVLYGIPLALICALWWLVGLAGLPTYSEKYRIAGPEQGGSIGSTLAGVGEMIRVEEAREQLLIQTWETTAVAAVILVIAAAAQRMRAR
ncbi:MAG: hypothetical protein HY898_17820 [Deltaproteobacteria bacterium]|nr:hypothetical protein [Deltaproteobacteria bacterium]